LVLLPSSLTRSQYTDPPFPHFVRVEYRLPRLMMNNYHCHFVGGTGGAGGPGYGNGVGGVGGDGTGPILNWDIRGDVTMNGTYHQHGERGIYILDRAAALGAIYDSAESFPQPRCHPETRTRMLDDLREWALATDPETSILWLYGPAGAGKSAIMQTLAGQLQDADRLSGCFFFKRGDSMRGNGKTLFVTIAYQLALNVSWLRKPISQGVENEPSIVARSIESQMRKLISGPCSRDGNCEPLAIIIDGLDEYNGHDVQQQILRVIRDASSKHPIPLRFIVASRPEAHIREVFDSPFYAGHHRSVNVKQSFDDVERYLSDEFSRIRREHRTMTNIPLPWPSPDVLEELVEKSSGHFIYASTIIKFIDDKNFRPTQRLTIVLEANSPGSESAFDPLDQLYMTILNSAPRQSDLVPVLGAIVHFTRRPEEIDQILGLAHGETRLVLRGLHSLLFLDDGYGISSHHASFLDFLNNPGRSRTFCVGTLQPRIDLARIILEAYVGPHENGDGFLSQFLRNNLMPFITSFPPSAEVTELLSLIGTIDPECIFGVSTTEVPGQMLAWLKKIPSASRALIKLWEDYGCMVSFEETVLMGSPTEHVFPCSPESIRMLVSLVVFRQGGLKGLRVLLDLTWTEMRTTICGLSSNGARDQQGLPVLAARLAFRDVALQCIRKMVKNQVDMGGQVYSREQYELANGISYLVRSSPPCPILYRELWRIPIAPIVYNRFSGTLLIQHISKWLESFSDPTTELIAFWKQAGGFDSKRFGLLGCGENGWRSVVKRWNSAILRLGLPDTLELPLPDFVGFYVY
ncbi:hypothetical protein C8R45DRAFT_495910, partial [Mycena sanguinolenta]